MAILVRKTMTWEFTPLESEVYDKIEEILRLGFLTMSLGEKTRWIHARDAYLDGSISFLEIHDAIALGYVPEHLTVRNSRYSHLL